MLLVAALSSLAGFVLGARVRTLGLMMLTMAMMASVFAGTLLSGAGIGAALLYTLASGLLCQTAAILSMILQPRAGRRPPSSRAGLVPARIASPARR